MEKTISTTAHITFTYELGFPGNTIDEMTELIAAMFEAEFGGPVSVDLDD